MVVFKTEVIGNLRDDSKGYPNWRWLEATQSAEISVTLAREATSRRRGVGGGQRGAAEHSGRSGEVHGLCRDSAGVVEGFAADIGWLAHCSGERAVEILAFLGCRLQQFVDALAIGWQVADGEADYDSEVVVPVPVWPSQHGGGGGDGANDGAAQVFGGLEFLPFVEVRGGLLEIPFGGRLGRLLDGVAPPGCDRGLLPSPFIICGLCDAFGDLPAPDLPSGLDGGSRLDRNILSNVEIC